MKNPYVYSIKDLCIQAKSKGEKLWLFHCYLVPYPEQGYYVYLSNYGHSRRYKSREYVQRALERACKKYNVTWV